MPILKPREAHDLAMQWRSKGKCKVGFTNGCFDLIHIGHISTLRFAREHCDRLIVGVDCDETVTRAKGEGRPINIQSHRAEILSEMRSVDAVVIFERSELGWLIQEINPDVIVKGAEYNEKYVVGAIYAHVLFAPMVPGISTTRLIRSCTS